MINEAIVKGPLLDVCNDCSDKNIKGVDHKRTLEICDKWKYKISRDCGHDSFEQKTFFRTGHKCIGWIHYTVRGLLFPGGGLLAFVRAPAGRAPRLRQCVGVFYGVGNAACSCLWREPRRFLLPAFAAARRASLRRLLGGTGLSVVC